MAVSGKFSLYLNRLKDINTLPIIDKNMMISDLEMERRGWPQTINEIKAVFPKMVNSGQVYGCGSSDFGSWGLPSSGVSGRVLYLQQNDRFDKPVSSLNAGCYHSVLILPEEKTIWGAGSNDKDQLGQGPSGSSDYTEYTRIDYSYGPAQDIIKAYGVGKNTFVINESERLLGCGWNSNGQLGVGDKVDRNYLTLIGGDTNWASVCNNGCWTCHVLCIKTNGTLWGMGYGLYGRLGTSDPDDVLTVTQIGSAGDWILAAISSNFSMAINDINELWATGLNSSGNLGLGDLEDRYALTKVVGSGWAKVACGMWYSLAIKTDGTLWGTGANATGECGLGEGLDYVTSFTQVGTDTDWADVACGDSHTIARKIDGSIWSTGYNNDGPLGLGDRIDRYEFERIGNLNDWTIIAAGETFTAVASERS